jgi:hypothetical protein
VTGREAGGDVHTLSKEASLTTTELRRVLGPRALVICGIVLIQSTSVTSSPQGMWQKSSQ